MWACGSCLGVAGPGSRGPLAPHDGYTMGSIRARPTRRVVSAQSTFWGLDRAGVGVPASWMGYRRAESICQWVEYEGAARTILGFHPEAQKEAGAGSQEQGGLWVDVCSGCARGAPREDVRKIHVCSPRERTQGHHMWDLGEAGDQEKWSARRWEPRAGTTSKPGGWAQTCQPTQVFRVH